MNYYFISTRALVAVCCTILLLSVNAFGRDSRTAEIKDGLGEVMAAEEICGFSYDQSAIAAFINIHVPKDDMDFAEDVEAHAYGQKQNLENASPSRKTAYCTQVGRMARNYGFMK